MKRRLLAFVLVVAMIMSMAPVTVLAADDSVIDTFGELKTAMEAGGTVTLLADVTLTEGIKVTKDVVIDLGGNTITGPSKDIDNGTIFSVSNGASLTVKNGKLISSGFGIRSDGNGSNANKIILNKVTLEAYGNFGIYHNGSYYGADVTITESTIYGYYYGVYLSGSNGWGDGKKNSLDITNSSVEGGATAVEVKRGDVTVTNSSLTSDYPYWFSQGYTNYVPTVNDNVSGPCTFGYALALTNSGTATTAEASTGTVTIKSGTFTGPIGIKDDDSTDMIANTENAKITIYGGTFKNGVDAEYIDPDCNFSAGSGTVISKSDAKYYVSLGDSMTNGYGLPGYDGNTGVEDYGEESYANQFAEYYGYNHAQLAMSAMRAEDLHWLLEVDYTEGSEDLAVIGRLENGWDEDLWYSVFTNGDYWTWRELIHNYRFDVAAYCIEGKDKDDDANGDGTYGDFSTNDAKAAYTNDVEALKVVAKHFQESVAKADVVSLGIGNGNFGVFMFGRITEAIGFDGEPEDVMVYNIENIYRDCNDELTAALKKLQAAADGILAGYGFAAENGDGEVTTNEALYNTLMYGVLSYAVNYAGSVEAILELNPNADIIQVALMNTVKSDTPSPTGEATLGDVMDNLFGPLNIYLAALPTYMQAVGHGLYDEAEFYWAEAPYVECIVDTYDDGLGETVRDRFYQSIVKNEDNKTGMVWGLLGDMVVDITLDEIKAYEAMTDDADKLAYAAQYSNKAMSIAMYLAFEKAIIEGKDTPVTIASVMGLSGLFEEDADPFGSIMVDFYAQAATDGAAKLPVVVEFLVNMANSMQDDITFDANMMSALIAKGDEADVYINGIAYSQATTGINTAMGQNFTVEEVKALYNNDADYNGAVTSAVNTAIASVKEAIYETYDFDGRAEQLCTLLVMPETLATVVAESELAGLLALFARCVIGNGIGSHPSADGHDALADELVATYGKYTAEEETDANLAQFKYAPVAKDVYLYLRTNNYIDENQALDIALYVLGKYMDDTLSDTKDTDVIKYVYNSIFQIGTDGLTDTQRLAIIGGVYDIIKGHGYLTGYAKYLNVLEDIIANETVKAHVSDEKAFGIVDFIYKTVMVETGDSYGDDFRKIVYYIWFETLALPVAAPVVYDTRIGTAGSSSGSPSGVEELTVEKKIEILEAVFDALEKNEALDTETYPQLESVQTLYDNLTAVDADGDQIVPDEVMIELFDKVIAAVGETDGNGEFVNDLSDSAVITEVATEIATTLLADDRIKDENKVVIVEEVSKALEEVGMGGNMDGTDGEGEEGEDSSYDLAVVAALRDRLEAAGYLTPAQQGQIISAVVAVLPTVMNGEQLTSDQMKAVAEDIYQIVFTREDLTFEDKIAILAITFEVLEEYGYVANAYASVMQKPEVAEKVSEAAGYIGIAIVAVDAAKAYAESDLVKQAVPAELQKSYELLLNELELAKGDLEEIKGILENAGDYDVDYAALMDLEDNLKAHYENIMALADELEIVITPYVEDLNEAVVYYSALVETIAEEVYNNIVNAVEEFNDEYAAWVEDMGALADEVDPVLGAAVRKFLTETPAETLGILYAYGKDAGEKLYVDAAAAAGDIYTIAAGLAKLLYENGEPIYNAVIDKVEYADIKGQIEDIIDEIADLAEKAQKAPVSTDYQSEIDALKRQLSDLYEDLYGIIREAANDVDPTIGPMIDELMGALGDALGIAGDAAGAYGSYLEDQVGAMAGELLDTLLENIGDLGSAACSVIDEIIGNIICEIYNFLYGVYEDVKDEVIAQLGLLEKELEALKGQLENAAGELYDEIMAQIAVIEAKIEAIKALIEEGLENIPEVLDALGELKNEVANLIGALKDTVYEETVKALEGIEKALEDLQNALPDAITEALEYVKEKLGDFGMYLINEIYEAVKKYAPEIADDIYDYLYNNPEEVIGFFKEYGDELLALAEEFGDEAMMLIGGILYYYGEDIAAYIIENADELVADMLAWFDEHGENTWALIQVYLEELGICDAAGALSGKLGEIMGAACEKVGDLIDDVIGLIEEKIDELEDAKDALIKQLESLKASLENELKDASEEVKEEIKKAIEEIEKAIEAIEDGIAALEDKINELREIAEDIAGAIEKVIEAIAMIDENIMAAIDALQDALKELADAVGALKDFAAELNDAIDGVQDVLADIIETITEISEKVGETAAKIVGEAIAVLEAVEATIAQIQAAIEEIAAAIEQAVADLQEAIYKAHYAVLSKCTYGDEMVYVSLGGATAANGTYADAVGEYVEADKVIKLGQAMLYADQYDYVIANSADIAKADLITYQMDANEIVSALVDVIIAVNLGDNYTEPNWNEYVDVEEIGKTAAEVTEEVEAIKAEIVEYLDEDTIAWVASIETEVIAKLKAFALENGIDEEAVEEARPYAEYLAYNLLAHAVETAEAIEAVNTINKTAPVVLVGMYNTLDGVTVKMNGQEIDLGEFFAYVVEVVDVYNLIYAIVSGNVTYVDASEATVDPTVIDVDAYLGMYAEIEILMAKVKVLSSSINPGDMAGMQAILDQINEINAQINALVAELNGVYAYLESIIGTTANAEGHAYIAEQIIDALIIVEHDVVTDEAAAPTCTDTGLTEGSHCVICGEVFVAQEVIPALGHTEGVPQIENTVPATCTVAGSYDKVIYCDTCGEELSRENIGIPATDVHTDGNGDNKCDDCNKELDTDKPDTPVVPTPGPGTPSTPDVDEKWECDRGEGCACKVFTDLKLDAWYHDAICYAYANEIMNGMSADKFEPSTTTSRAMIVTTLYRLEGEPKVTGENTYTDVKDDVWYTDAIIWATEKGIVNGYGEGKFGPADDVTREQIATMLYRYADYKGMDTSAASDLKGYTDADQIHAWALDAMKWASAIELMEGRTETTLNPRDNTMRSELATLLYRWCEDIVK